LEKEIEALKKKLLDKESEIEYLEDKIITLENTGGSYKTNINPIDYGITIDTSELRYQHNPYEIRETNSTVQSNWSRRYSTADFYWGHPRSLRISGDGENT